MCLSLRATLTRSALALTIGGTVVGLVVGGAVGYQVFSHDCGGCDDPGLNQIVYGAFVGTPIGAALGAALPRLGSVCSFPQRIQSTLIGAGAGGALGFLAGFVEGEAILITVPAFSVGGALGSLG